MQNLTVQDLKDVLSLALSFECYNHNQSIISIADKVQ